MRDLEDFIEELQVLAEQPGAKNWPVVTSDDSDPIIEVQSDTEHPMIIVIS